MKKLFALFMLATAASAYGMIESDIFNQKRTCKEIVAYFDDTNNPDMTPENLQCVLAKIKERYLSLQFKIRNDYIKTQRSFDGVDRTFNNLRGLDSSITLLGNVVINGEKFWDERQEEKKSSRRFWMPIVRFMRTPQGWMTFGMLGIYALALCLTSPDQRKANKEGPQVAFGVHHVSTSGGNSW